MKRLIALRKPKGAVEAILAYVPFHLADPARAAAEAARVLRPGGRAGIITWAWERQPRASTGWDQVLAEAGANVVVFGLGGIGLNVVQGARLAGLAAQHAMLPHGLGDLVLTCSSAQSRRQGTSPRRNASPNSDSTRAPRRSTRAQGSAWRHFTGSCSSRVARSRSNLNWAPERLSRSICLESGRRRLRCSLPRR